MEVERDRVDAMLSDAWKSPVLPLNQFEACTKRELESYRRGQPVQPYDVLVDILQNNLGDLDGKSLLEVGCSSGYYSEVLQIKGIRAEYHGCDYSPTFVQFARELYPEPDFQVRDARSLGYPDEAFDIVVSGGCILHILEYPSAIAESARVAREHVVFHRTPVLHDRQTTYYLKTAYNVRLFEIHFNERELLKSFQDNDLRVVDVITLGSTSEVSSRDWEAQRTYLCEKV